MPPGPEPTTLPFAGTTARALIESLEAAVARGDVQPGSALPSVRGLAESLDISPAR
jgi:DNA-binding FadR family transcriptional regulator